MKRKSYFAILLILIILIGIIVLIRMNKKLTFEEITGIDFDDISYISSDREGIDTDLSKFRNEYENKVYQKQKSSSVRGTTVAYKIYCYDINDNVICTIYCNGHGYYFAAGKKDNFSNEVLYNYGEYK